ncbi:Alpha/Beta hydrolase protein [Microdochium bolleyi]|uniref:Alpha/Beta hydrolase protein n=1 Tax=Microdochium bolleyi TaxID=196109 RepID=A0A136INV7_9PEZI|nr:Alpha/Beta hydrolase protein [Microdochium bolleyi]
MSSFPAANMLLSALAGSMLASVAHAQFVSPPADLTHKMGAAGVPVRFKQVPPGICELDPKVKSYSGYSDVAEDQHIFWWFFEARNQKPSEAPLTVWINGGPGSTSLIGLFEELGPCRIDPDGNVLDNPYSWTNASNVLFIDQPNFTGFSYGRPVPAYTNDAGDIVPLPNATCPDSAPPGTCGTYSAADFNSTANSTQAAAPAFWKTLQGFMGAFPQYSQHGYHFASESYGGHYGPVFNAYIEEQNDLQIPGALHINVKSVLIGNGWYDPAVGYESYYNFTVPSDSGKIRNTYNYAPYNASVVSQLHAAVYGKGGCLDGLAECKRTGDDAVCSQADNYCASNVEFVLDDVTGRDEYDIRELTPDPFPYGFWRDYVNTPRVQAALGAFVNSSVSSSTVSAAFGATGDDGREVGTVEALRYLAEERNVSVALYAGDADYICNWLGNEATAESVRAKGFSSAGYTDVITSDRVVHAQTKQAGKFSFTRVFEAGHEVPFYQPLAALQMFERVIRGKDVATGCKTVDAAYRTRGTLQSTYREGNKTMQFELTPQNATYDVATGAPGPAWGTKSSRGAVRLRRRRVFDGR